MNKKFYMISSILNENNLVIIPDRDYSEVGKKVGKKAIAVIVKVASKKPSRSSKIIKVAGSLSNRLIDFSFNKNKKQLLLKKIQPKTTL